MFNARVVVTRIEEIHSDYDFHVGPVSLSPILSGMLKIGTLIKDTTFPEAC